MPRTHLDRLTPETVRRHWVNDFAKKVEAHRFRMKPTYKEMAAAAGVSYGTFYSKYGTDKKEGTGGWTVREYMDLTSFLGFTKDEQMEMLSRWLA